MDQANHMNHICVFGASSDNIDDKYKREAYALGALIARSRFKLVFGAGDSGLMGAVARGARDAGGSVIGIIPEKLNAPGVAFANCSQLIVTKTMHERKALMKDMSQAFIALPGGFGTLEELMEIITLKQLGYVEYPVCILNSSSYYDCLIEQFNNLIGEGFADDSTLELFYVANTPQAAIEHILEYKPKPLC